MAPPWRVCLLVLSAGIAAGVACDDGPTDPSGTLPNFNHTNTVPAEYDQFCRMYQDGSLWHSDGTGGWLFGCDISVQGTPTNYIVATNPRAITFQFSSPALNPMIQTDGALALPCPTVPLYAAAYDGAVLLDSVPLDSGGCAQRFPEHYAFVGRVTKLVVTPCQPASMSDIHFMIHYFTPCPVTNDSALDSPTVRKRLNQEWNLSNQERKERGGWILHNDATGQDSVWFDAGAPRRDLCHDYFSPVPPQYQGWRPYRMWHTHIVDPGILFGTLGPDCSDYPPEKKTGNGPDKSWGDRGMTEQGHKPHIVIDANEIFIQYPMELGGGTIAWDWVRACRLVT